MIKTRGAKLIAAERRRQQTMECLSAEHDAQWTNGELALAAIVYACPPRRNKWRLMLRRMLWPWDSGWWKPRTRIRDLVRAGALIAAEIDRLLATGEKP